MSSQLTEKHNESIQTRIQWHTTRKKEMEEKSSILFIPLHFTKTWRSYSMTMVTHVLQATYLDLGSFHSMMVFFLLYLFGYLLDSFHVLASSAAWGHKSNNPWYCLITIFSFLSQLWSFFLSFLSLFSQIFHWTIHPIFCLLFMTPKFFQ